MELFDSVGDRYCEYLLAYHPHIDASILSTVEEIVTDTNWSAPASSRDWNNLAVLNLIDADLAQSLEEKSSCIQTALEDLEKGFNIDQNPLCAAHYALIQTMVGKMTEPANLSYSTIMNTIQVAFGHSDRLKSGLIYLPFRVRHPQELVTILTTTDGYTQALMLLAESLWRSQLVFYNVGAMQSLDLGTQIFVNSPSLNLMLGISKIMGGRIEGLLNLHRAFEMASTQSDVLQALYLGYRTLGNLETANYMLQQAANYCLANDLAGAEWEWTKLEADSSITYVPFEENLVLAIEPSFKSIVTSILVGQKDWFEDEMEFWRNYLKPNMTVIDVGANAGVYTFSAANKVGDSGLILAIEPFSQCVNYLKETCRINNLTNVKVIAAAASDRSGTIKLAISSASELNQIITEAESESANFSNYEEVESITLDLLCDRYGLTNIDILKIDAEGHELQVLEGSDRILSAYSPVIMYENISGTQTNSLPVAEFLISKGYSLFRYQPYLQKLIPIDINAEVQQSLNIIAIREN
jgi:FkbM family methyltransferase